MGVRTASRLFPMVEKGIADYLDTFRRYRGVLRLALQTIFCALLMAGCSSGPPATGVPHEVRPTTPTNTLRPPDSVTPAGAYEAVPDYRIGANDLLDISVF